jgi:hypothetical protein
MSYQLGPISISGSVVTITGSIATTQQTETTASWAVNALTASFALNGGGGSTNTGSLLTTASVSLNTITFTKGDGSTFPITVNTGSGGSFVDTSAFVTTSSFNNYTSSAASTFAGTSATASYSNNFIIGSTLTLDATLTDFSAISPSTGPGINNLFTKNTGSFTSAFGKYTIFSGSNSRAGEFITSWNGTTTSYYDNSTVDIGNTSAITFASVIVSGEIEINTGASTPSGWQVKMLVTFM